MISEHRSRRKKSSLEQCTLGHSLMQIGCTETVIVRLCCGHSFETLCFERDSFRNEECTKKVKWKLTCGHWIPGIRCSQTQDLVNFICKTEVKRFQKCGHFLGNSPCYSPIINDEPCTVLVSKNLPCGHSVTHRCAYPVDDIQCNQPVSKTLHDCQHLITVPCHSKDLDYNCNRKELRSLQCGHQMVSCDEVPKGLCTELIVINKLRCQHTIKLLCWELEGQSVSRWKNKLCFEMCGTTQRCGHVCEYPCHRMGKDPHCILPRNRLTPPDAPCLGNCKKLCFRRHVCGTPSSCGAHYNERCNPCTMEIKTLLDCGKHFVTDICGQYGERYSRRCSEKCDGKLVCSHPCPNLCHIGICVGKCLVLVSKYQMDCGHESTTTCYNNWSYPTRCYAPVAYPYRPSDCGHYVEVPCYLRNKNFEETQLRKYCETPCNFDLICGDICKGTCSSCKQGRLHVNCEECRNSICGRTMICGHLCKSQRGSCPPCQETCNFLCAHGRCSKICGYPCVVCRGSAQCPLRCSHHKCNIINCERICNKEPCSLPCPKLLVCGHSCVGFCGDSCPPLCRICSRDKLQTGILDGSDLSDEHRFIYLRTCEHSIEAESFTLWISTAQDDAEIILKTCPLCKTPITFVPRFSKILRQIHRDVFEIHLKVFGEPETNLKDQKYLYQLLTARRQTNVGDDTDYEIYKNLRKKLVSFIYSHVAEFTFNHLPIGNISRGLLEQIRVIGEWSVQIEIFRQEYLTVHGIEVLQGVTDMISHWLMEKKLPLYGQELIDLNHELARSLDIATLLQSSVNYQDGRPRYGITQEVEEAIGIALDVVLRPVPYDEGYRELFLATKANLDSVNRHTLNLLDSERIQIVGAMGAVGRWFKCPNGHVYVIGDCGGPTEVSICYECGALIGGEQHRLRRDNTLASEMDGAIRPLYTTTLQHYDDNDDN